MSSFCIIMERESAATVAALLAISLDRRRLVSAAGADMGGIIIGTSRLLSFRWCCVCVVAIEEVGFGLLIALPLPMTMRVS